MTGLRWTLAIGALVSAAACGRKPDTSAAADATISTPKDSAGQSAADAATKVESFQAPESARYDPDLDVWYVSNINGSPVAKDDNGYISRLKGDGTVDSMKFIEGGKGGVTLNGPKGLALQGDTLWVADIDAVRGFNRRTGAPVASVTLKGAHFLNDLAVGPDGVYITDTGFKPDASMKHIGPDRVYRVGPGRSQSVAIEGDSLAGPNGITWDAARRQFVIVPFLGQTIRTWAPGSKTTSPLATTRGQLDGVEVIEGNRLLFTSWADSSLDVLENGTVTTASKGLPSPADIGVDTKRHRVAIPLLMENRIEFRSIPAAGAAAAGKPAS